MELTQEHLDFEKKCKLLIGLTLLKVEYLEVDYYVVDSNPKPWYQTKLKDIDSVDFSIILHFENENSGEVYWDGQFYQYGIGLQLNENLVFSSYRKWEVTKNDLWKKFIGHSILTRRLRGNL